MVQYVFKPDIAEQSISETMYMKEELNLKRTDPTLFVVFFFSVCFKGYYVSFLRSTVSPSFLFTILIFSNISSDSLKKV